MRFAFAITLVLVVILAGCDNQTKTKSERNERPQPKRTIALSNADILRLGIETAPAQAIQYTPQVHGYGVIVNTTALAQLDAAIMTAEAAQLQSQAALKRARVLFGDAHTIHAISREALDAAERQAAADEAAVTLADRSETAAFGRDAPWRGKKRDRKMLADLTSARTMLVEATFSLGGRLAALPSRLTVAHLHTRPDQAGSTATVIWNAPADPMIPGRSFFALVKNSDLQQGEHVLVYAPTGKPIAGVRIPSASVVLNDDRVWCYAAVSHRTFVRIPIDLSTPVPGGYFVAQGISAGQPVVVAGTGLLLAQEIGVAAAGYN